MNQDSGFGTNGVPYEYTVSEAKSFSLTMRRILLILLYVAWCVGFFMARVITKLAVPMIAIVPLTIRLGEDSFLDGHSFTVEDMYARYHKDGTLPKTSAPRMPRFGFQSTKMTSAMASQPNASMIPAFSQLPLM